MRRATMYLSAGAFVLSLIAVTVLAPRANATTISDFLSGSSATVDNASGNVTSLFATIPPSGLVQQLGGGGSPPQIEQFYYRVGSSGPLVPFSSITWSAPTTASGFVSYSGTQALFNVVNLSYTINGNQLNETMTVQQTTSSALQLSIFQLATLNLNDAGNPHTNISVGQAGGTNKASVDDGATTQFIETSTGILTLGAGGTHLDSITPYYQAGTGSAGNNMLFGNTGNLNDTGGFSGTNGEFAFEWSSSFGADAGDESQLTFNQTFSTFTTSAVPEPATTVLSFLGLAALAGASVRRRVRRDSCPA